MIRELKGHQIDKAFAEGEVITSNSGIDRDGYPINESFYADDGRPWFAGEKEAAERQAELQRKEAEECDPETERKITALYNSALRRRYEEGE